MRRILSRHDDIEFAGAARDGDEAAALIERHRPHVAVLDLRMPGRDGIELCAELQAADSPTAVIIYTGFEERDVVRRAMKAGARGVVTKTAPADELARAVRTVADGGTFVDPTLGQDLFQASNDGRAELSNREIESLALLAQGFTTDRAAEAMHLSPATVRSYVENVMAKLSVSTRTQAVAEAVR